MRRKDNYIIMKMNKPKRVTLLTVEPSLHDISISLELNYLQMLLLDKDISKELHPKTKEEKEVNREVAESMILLKK